jgi:hypothetical protein
MYRNLDVAYWTVLAKITYIPPVSQTVVKNDKNERFHGFQRNYDVIYIVYTIYKYVNKNI